MTEEAEERMRNQEKYFTGFHDGHDEGKIEGKLETQTLIVKNLLNNSVPDDIIFKSTNISHEELENIKKTIKSNIFNIKKCNLTCIFLVLNYMKKLKNL